MTHKQTITITKNSYSDDKKKIQNPYSVIYNERNIEQAHIPHAPSLLDN